jgi:hypothetical protein
MRDRLLALAPPTKRAARRPAAMADAQPEEAPPAEAPQDAEQLAPAADEEAAKAAPAQYVKPSLDVANAEGAPRTSAGRLRCGAGCAAGAQG